LRIRGVRRQIALRKNCPRYSERPGTRCEIRATLPAHAASSTMRRDSPKPRVTRRRWARLHSEQAASGCMSSAVQ